MRHSFEFDEPSANVVVVIDVKRKPKKTLPKDVPLGRPRVDALVQMIAEFIQRECSDDTAMAA